MNYLHPGPGLPEVSVTLRSGDRFPLQWLLPRDQLETLLSHWDSELNETQLQSFGTPFPHQSIKKRWPHRSRSWWVDMKQESWNLKGQATSPHSHESINIDYQQVHVTHNWLAIITHPRFFDIPLRTLESLGFQHGREIHHCHQWLHSALIRPWSWI